jgi:hypothetical protein
MQQFVEKGDGQKSQGPSPHLIIHLGEKNGSGGYPIEHILRSPTATTR